LALPIFFFFFFFQTSLYQKTLKARCQKEKTKPTDFVIYPVKNDLNALLSAPSNILVIGRRASRLFFFM